MKRSAITGCLLSLALLSGCADAKVARRQKSPVRPSAVAPLVLERDPLPLAERLAREGSEHPEARQAVERTLKEFERAGIPLVRTRQALARPLAARYCATALTAAGLGLSLCAFADGAAAELGRARSRQSFDALIPGRTLHVRASSLLTVTQPASEAARGEADQIVSRFSQPASAEHAAL
jgi:hypothetical protein